MKLMRFLQTAVSLGVMALALPASADVPSPNLDQSQANRLSIFHDYSIDGAGSTRGNVPTPGSGGLATPFLASGAPSDTTALEKSWFVSGTPLAGYDSNPEARQHATSSLFAGFDVDAGYTKILTPDNPTNIFANIEMVGALYEGMVKQANIFQPAASAGIRHAFLGDTIVLSGQLKDQLTLENGDAFLNVLDVVPSLEAFWFPQFSTEIALDYAHMEYFFPAALEDPDTERNTLMLNFHLYTLPQGRNAVVDESPDQLTDILRQSLHSVIIGFDHVWNKADGRGYQYEANRITFGLEGIRPLKSRDLELDIDYGHEWQDYTGDIRPTTSSVGGRVPQIRRHDHLDVLTLRANARLWDLPHDRGALGGFFQWDWIRDFSFIQARDFNEFLVSGGLTYRY